MALEIIPDLRINHLTRQALAYLDHLAENRAIAFSQKRDTYLEIAQILDSIPGEEEPGVSRPSRAKLVLYQAAGELDEEVIEAERLGRLALQKSTELSWGGITGGVKVERISANTARVTLLEAWEDALPGPDMVDIDEEANIRKTSITTELILPLIP